MLCFDRVASLFAFGRFLAWACALLGWMLTNGAACADPPLDQAVARLIAQLHQPAAGSRAAAANSLARYGARGVAATDALIECLNDTDDDVRLSAAYALGCVQQDSVRVVEALVPLLAESDEHVRYSAEWSLARIARNLEDRFDASQRSGLISAFDTAIDHLKTYEHQPRHLVAMELAVGRLRQSSVEQLASAPPPEAQREQAPVASDPAVDGLELASRVYSASDRMGRLQFVERLSDLEKYSDDMRRVVIRIERREEDTAVLRYAVARWGSRGQQLLAQQAEELSHQAALEDVDASIFELIEPESEQQSDQLAQLVLGRSHAVEVRLAALSAIRTARFAGTHCTECLLDVLADANDDQEVRAAAAETLAGFGATAARAEARLITILHAEHDPWLRQAIAHALARTAAASPTAAHAMHAALCDTPSDSQCYCDMIESCGAFGSLASECMPQLVAGLHHEDELVRLSCARCVGRIGPSAGSASTALVERILEAEEHSSVKDAAAQALCSIGREGLKHLSAGLASRDPATREHALRALAAAGPTADFLCNECLAALNDTHASVAVRSAAAAAVGAMGKSSSRAVPKLLELASSDQPDRLRAASLLAAAQIDPQAVRPHIDRCSGEKSVLMRASAACAYRLTGDAKTGFDMLVNMLDGSETDEVIERALEEFGPASQGWLLEVARDANASADKRLACFRLVSSGSSPPWSELLPLVEDDELGDELAMSLGEEVTHDPRAVTTLLARLREQELTPASHARMVRLLTPDGLGAGGDDETWQGGLTLTRPAAIETLTAADRKAADVALSIGNSATSGAAQPGVVTHPSSEPLGGGGRSGGAVNPQSKPVTSNEPFRPGAAARAGSADTLLLSSAGAPHLVEVFYGTNRSRVATEKPGNELAASLVATLGGVLVAMLVCTIGVLRSGYRTLAWVGLITVLAVTPFGYQAAQSYARSTLRPEVVYGGEYCSQIELGVCQVSIPPGHEPGELESPNLLKLEVKQDIQKHVVLTSVEQLPQDRFFQQLHSRMDADGKNILVFIHGYNVSFEDAARRTAQMAEDLKFPGAPVFYSWPSQANWYGYKTDKENIELSVTQIKAFLLDLAAESGATTINLVAHSMGNVGLTQALKEMEASNPEPLFNQVVLAAPDIDADVFKNRVAPYIVTKAHHVTLYTSQTDLALIASRYFNSGPRVGDSGPGVSLFPGIDTIDATAVDTSLLGHSYYGSNVSVLTDLGCVLQNQPIASRQYLREIIDAAQPYWAFDPVRISQTPATGTQR